MTQMFNKSCKEQFIQTIQTLPYMPINTTMGTKQEQTLNMSIIKDKFMKLDHKFFIFTKF